jgi:hypothetical protein
MRILWEGQELVVDAAIKETFEGDAQPTEHPVEDGTTIADHVITKPEQIVIEGVISDNSLGYTGLMLGYPTGNVIKGRARESFDKLRALLLTHTLCSLDTGRGVYDSMLLVKLSSPRDAKTGAAVEFSATFRAMVTAVTAQVVVEQVPGAKNSAGKKATHEVKPAWNPNDANSPMHNVRDWAYSILRKPIPK